MTTVSTGAERRAENWFVNIPPSFLLGRRPLAAVAASGSALCPPPARLSITVGCFRARSLSHLVDFWALSLSQPLLWPTSRGESLYSSFLLFRYPHPIHSGDTVTTVTITTIAFAINRQQYLLWTYSIRTSPIHLQLVESHAPGSYPNRKHLPLPLHHPHREHGPTRIELRATRSCNDLTKPPRLHCAPAPPL